MRQSLLLLSLTSLLAISNCPAGLAQSYSADDGSALQGMAQIDITGGLADRSAQYAMQQVAPGYAAPVPPQAQVMQPPTSMNIGATAYPPQPTYAPAQPQGYPPQAPYAYQAPPQAYQAPAAQGQWAPAAQAPKEQAPANPKLMTQMMGALGAATMFSVLSNGGMDSILSPLKSRGFSPRFHTYGSCIGGNVSF